MSTGACTAHGGGAGAPQIVLLGASGFIGSAVREHARTLGLSVVAVRAPRLRFEPSRAHRIPDVAQHQGVVDSLAAAIPVGSVVVNAAGAAQATSDDGSHLYGANALLPWVVAQAAQAAGATRLVHVSSAAVKGTLPLDAGPDAAPFSPYSRSKALGEEWLRTVEGPETTILRPTSVHAPGRSVTKLLRRVARGPLSSVAGRGDRPTPQVQLGTVARSVLLLATHPGPVPPITLTPDEHVTTGSFLTLLGGRRPLPVPESVARATVRMLRQLSGLHGTVAGNVRRLELLWFGQKQERSWLDDHPRARAPRSGWRALATASSRHAAPKVVVLNQFALPSSEGGFTRNEDLFSRLRGFDYRIVAGNRHHYTQRTFVSDDPRFRLVAVPAAGASLRDRLLPWLTYSAQAFLSTVRERDLAMVYASTPHLLTPVVGLLAARLRRVPFVLEVRDIWPESIVSAGQLTEDSVLYRVLRGLEITLVRSADAVVGVSPAWRPYFEGIGLAPHRYWAVPNGAEAELFEVAESRADLRREFGISGFTAIFAGAHGPKDGIDHILDAAAVVPEINVLLVGDGTCKRAAIERAERERIRNVTFRDWVPKSELPRLLAACDAGIHAVTPLPVFERGMSPNKLFDYLAAGLPVVSNAAGPLAGVLAPDECGVLGGPDELAAGLRAIRDVDAATRERWRRRGRELVTDVYSRTSVAATLATALHQALGRPVRREDG